MADSNSNSASGTLISISSNNAAPDTGGVRFAPSPTGRFHIGNLRTAWISNLLAKHLNLPWIVRFEDIDKPRVVAGAMEEQLRDMKSLDLKPDLVLVQSSFFKRHWDVFAEGVKSGKIYPCDCSRKDVQSALSSIASAPHDRSIPVYSGHCRHLGQRELHAAETLAWRFRSDTETGHHDFIVARTHHSLDASRLPDPSSFTPAYHWACAIDDFDGNYDLLVRASDLKVALVMQREIQSWLAKVENAKTRLPAVFHTALITQNDGQRLEKRTRGVTLSEILFTGISTTEIINSFSASFEYDAFELQGLQSAAIFGEKNDSLKLSDLRLN